MRVIICGGRDYIGVRALWRRLDALDKQWEPKGGIRVVIDGASDDVTGPYIGADYWAHQWALARGKSTIRVSAEWKRMGRAAGVRRNQRMIDEYEATACVAFPGGRGTDDMVQRALRAGLIVEDYR